MKYRKIASVLAAATAFAAVAPTLPAGAAVSPDARALGTQPLSAVLVDNNRFDKNSRDFDIVTEAVLAVLAAKPGSPVGALADGKVRLTAFVPNDGAFRKFTADVLGKNIRKERKVFKKLANNFTIDQIEGVLLYHVVPGRPITYRQALKANGARLTTAQGDVLRVKVRRGVVTLKDRDPNDANARVLKRAKNINKGNRQIAHGISQVLRPVDL